MFIFLTLIFSTISGNRINSLRIPFAIEAGLDADWFTTDNTLSPQKPESDSFLGDKKMIFKLF